MQNLANITIRMLLWAAVTLLCKLLPGQTNCRFFVEYKNEIKTWAASTIDSLEKRGIDTILFYGIGGPETGRMVFGKIVWASNGVLTKVETSCKYYDNAFHLTMPKYSDADFGAIQFYSDYRLDTVHTNPGEYIWMSHDFLHFVYSKIHGIETCFIAEDYLLRGDREHLRAKWIMKLSEEVPPQALWPR